MCSSRRAGFLARSRGVSSARDDEEAGAAAARSRGGGGPTMSGSLAHPAALPETELGSTAPPTRDDVAWHGLTADETYERLGVDPRSGLDAAEVERRRAEVGANRLAEA